MRQLARFAVLGLCLAATATTTEAEVTQSGNVVITFGGGMSPKRLPRHGAAPVRVHVGAAIGTVDGSRPPQLEEIILDINRHGHLIDRGLPTCRRRQLVAATTRSALAACRPALVGQGHVSAKISLPDQAPLPSEGELLAFNGRKHGQPVIYGHVYGDTPLPVTSVVPFYLRRAHGKFGTRLVASFPHVASDWGYVTGFNLELGRRYRVQGRRQSFLNAGCPAPPSLPGALFTLARARYRFDDGRELTSSLIRSCKASG